MEFTQSQKLAIDLRNRNILVSAAAGSGKTATLIERIIRLLTDRTYPAQINRMLIVTFTRAAAGELRSRISKALSKALTQDPANRHIAMQLTSLGSAKICTIDSYYLNLVKSNFQRLGLPASFRLADETELMILRKETMESVINRRYETDVEFIRYADQLTTAKNEYSLSELLLEISNKLDSLPDGSDYLEKCADKYALSADLDFFKTANGASLLTSIDEEINDMIKRCDRLIEIIDSDSSVTPYASAVTADRDFLFSFAESFKQKNYELSRTLLFNYKAVALGRVPSKDKSENSEQVKDERNEIKERINSLKTREFFAHPDDIKLFSESNRDFCIKTQEIIKDYVSAYTLEKNNRKICEFSDLRKYAFELLIDKSGSPTELAKSEQSNYDHIFVDEYQDTDSIQDRIFNAISNGSNLFFVGDIKQSIYSFRGAEPSVFSKYRKLYKPAESLDPEANESASVFMSENFRCSPNVVSFVNGVCSYLFRETEGENRGIGYLAEDDLIASRQAPISDDKVKIILIEKSEESEKGNPEHSYVISEIKKLLKNGKKPDGSQILPKDIAILTRSNKEATKISESLAKAGIPRANSTGSDLFENPEVLLMLCILTAADNPQRDVPLTGALRSPIFGFTMSDLINVKVGRNHLSLFDALTEYATSPDSKPALRDKCIKTIEKLNCYRRQAEAKPVHLFMRYIWNDTNALSYAGSDVNSKNRTPIERRRNLRMFYDYARRFEASSFKGLNEFIEFINGIIENRTEISAEDASSENTVRIMTVHKSKGLEFPIVFLIGTDKAHANQDARSPFAFTTAADLGIACKFYDDTSGTYFDTPFRTAILNKISELSSEEEIRILYVALTRARDSLYILASGNEGFAEKKLSTAFKKAAIGGRFGVQSSTRWIDRILLALASDPLNSSYVIETPFSVDASVDIDNVIGDRTVDMNRVGQMYSEIKSSLMFEYPYIDHSEIPAKISVSKLYPELLDEETSKEALLAKVKFLESKKPRFIEGKSGAAEKGTATHLFLQFCDFDNLKPSKESVENEIARLVASRYITNDISKLIRANELIKFARSALFNDLKRSKKIYRELRFNVYIPASELTTDNDLKETYSDQKVLVQGVIDLCYVGEGGEIILCDYKTDRIPDEIKDDYEAIKKMFRSSHAQQLNYYSYAIKNIFGKEPDRVLIYSLAYGDTFEIE